MNSSLDTFLSTHKVGKGEDFTHTQLGSSAGSYYIPTSDTPKFHKLYKRALTSKQSLHITEKHKSISPVLIDLDFRQDNPERNYTHDHVIGFLNALQKELFQHVQVHELPIYVLEKEAPRLDKSGKVYKDGIHAIIPGIVTCPAIQHVIRAKIIENDPDVLKIPGVTNTIQDIYDEAVIERNNWFMYGSMKPDETFPWLVTHKYVIRDEGECFEEEIDQLDVSLVDMLSIRLEVYDESRYTIEGKAAISKFNKKKQPPLSESKPFKAKFAPVASSILQSRSNPQDTELALNLVKLLDAKRAIAYKTWIEVGWCLFSVDSSQDFLDTWIEFSKLSTAHTHSCVSECAEKWNTMQKGSYSVASLVFWAKQDAPEELSQLMSSRVFTKESDITLWVLQMSESVHPYSVVKAIFEKTHFKIMTPGYVSIDEDMRATFYDEARMKKAYRNLWCSYGKETKKNVQFINKWFDDARVRTYKTTDFLPPPCVCPPDVYNLWRGFAADKHNAPSSGNVEPFLDHIRILAGKKDEFFDYLLKWLAQIIQEPGKLVGIAVVFISSQGAGKNIFLNGFSNMIGMDYYYETADPKKDLFDTFSNGFKSRLLIDMDEAQAKDTLAISEQLKKAIDSKTMPFRQKFMDNITMRNFCRFVFTTNNDLCVQITESTRRYVVFETSNEKVGDKAYFKQFDAYMKDKANQTAIMEYLRAVDYSNINWINDRPISAAYEALKSNHMDEMLKFMEFLWKTNTHKEDITFIATPFYQHFINFLKKKLHFSQDKQLAWTQSRFSRRITMLVDSTSGGIQRKENFGPKRAVAYIVDIAKMHTYLVGKGVVNKVTYDFLDMESDDGGDEQDMME